MTVEPEFTIMVMTGSSGFAKRVRALNSWRHESDAAFNIKRAFYN